MRTRLLVSSVAAASVMLTLGVASAQQLDQPNPPPPASAATPSGEFVTPMDQKTQPTYVPQSVAMTGPRVIKDWNEEDPIPPGYHRSSRPRTGMIVGGAVMFGVPYFISAMIAAVGSDVGSSSVTPLWVPVLGPFIEMGKTDSSTARLFLALDGALQAGGAFMLIYGIVAPKPVLVRNDLAFTVVPIARHDMGGLSLVGTF